jgi:hypothetical protein
MGDTYPSIDGQLAAFLTAQHVFFVGTAPLAADGHVNLSPKGHDTFRVVDPDTVAYLDLTGSGIETVAHLRENGRIVFCFCAFEGPPRIVRLHGRGEVLEPTAPDFASLRPLFPALDGVRSIIRVELRRIADSCGYAVPLDALRGRPAPAHRVDGEEGAGGRRRVPGDAEPAEPRRPPGAQAAR